MYYTKMSQYLMNIGKDYAKQALENARRAGTLNYPLIGFGMCVEPLRHAFVWSDTPEGYNYWHNVSQDLKRRYKIQ